MQTAFARIFFLIASPRSWIRNRLTGGSSGVPISTRSSLSPQGVNTTTFHRMRESGARYITAKAHTTSSQFIVYRESAGTPRA
jgi:hypothetical protein